MCVPQCPPVIEVVAESKGVSPGFGKTKKAKNKVPSSCVVIEVLIEILLLSTFLSPKR